MCGRVFVKSTFTELMAGFSQARASDDPVLAGGPIYNAAPSLIYPIIVRDAASIHGAFVPARWGLIAPWAKEPRPKIMPANARCETITTNGLFRNFYRRQRCLVPVDGYFEWRATKGAKVKQPYAIAMKTGKPFVMAGIWAERRHPLTAELERTFAIVTCPPNELMATIHDRMPVILHAQDYGRWLGEEPDPADLMVPFPSELMAMWPVSTRVNSVRNQGADLLDPIDMGDSGFL
jgi:putative SOS response-associated peptidase YedK